MAVLEMANWMGSRYSFNVLGKCYLYYRICTRNVDCEAAQGRQALKIGGTGPPAPIWNRFCI